MSSNRAPRGTASFSGPSASGRVGPATSVTRRSFASGALPALLLGLRDVDPLEVEGEAGRRQVDAEAAASARRSGRRRRGRGRAPGRRPRGSRRCSSRGRAAGRGRSGPGPRRRAPRARRRSPAAARWPARPPRRRARAPGRGPPAAAQLAQRDQGLALLASRSPRARRAPASRPTRSCVAELLEHAGPAPRPRPRARSAAGGRGRRRRGRSRARSRPAASSAAPSTSITSAVPSGAGAPISSTPAWHELAHLAALRAHGPVGVGDVAEAERRLGAGVAGGDSRAIGIVMSERSASSSPRSSKKR